MTTSQLPSSPTGVRPDELARHIAEMYRDVANAAVDDLHFHTGRVLAEALGYPTNTLDRLPAEAVDSFAGVGYHLDLARLIAVAKAQRLRRDDHVAFRRARIEQLPFDDLWAACIAGAGQRDQYLQDIAAAGLQLRAIQRNRAYRFASERAQRTSDKYGAHTIELLAVKPKKELSR